MTPPGRPAARRPSPILTGLTVVIACLLGSAAAVARDGVLTPGAFHHEADGPDQVVWATAESPAIRYLTVRFSCAARDAIDKSGVRIYRLDDQGLEGFRDYDAVRRGEVDSLAIRALTVPLVDDPRVGPEASRWRGYRIWLDDGERMFWCGADSLGVKEARVRRFERLFRPGITPGTISDRVVLVPGWVGDAVAVRLDVARFANGDPGNDPPGGAPGGDLAGVLASLASLDSLGVTTLVLSPLVRAAADDPGATLDLLSIDPRYGDLGQFSVLVERAHARKMKIVATLPLSRVSRAHPWVRDAIEWKEESEFRAFFRPSAGGGVGGAGGAGGTAAGADTTGWTAWNGENPEVIEELLGAVHLWSNTRMDGWYLPDLDEQPVGFWQSMTAAMKALDPTCWVIGVSARPPAEWLTGDMFDALDGPEFGREVATFATGPTPDALRLAAALDRGRSATPEPYARTAFNTLPREGLDDAKAGSLAMLLQMTSEGVPVIDGALIRLPEERRRLRELIQFRREHPCLRRGSAEAMLLADGTWAVLRRTSDEIFLVVVNRSDKPLSARLPISGSLGQIRQRDAVDLLSGSRHALRSGELFLTDVPAGSGALIRLR